ncbi:MAG: carbon storage regulator [Planctomycetales bacterium]|nr:carbon storage regulator [Planctomycetales bacterium]
MLVLTRRKDQRIIIHGPSVITIVDVIGGKVRVGIDADRDVAVHREEVQRRIDGEGEGRVEET